MVRNFRLSPEYTRAYERARIWITCRLVVCSVDGSSPRPQRYSSSGSWLTMIIWWFSMLKFSAPRNEL